MDKDIIFGLFSDSSEVSGEVKKEDENLISFSDSPYYKLGMFTKLIINHNTFHTKLEKFLKKEESTYNVESTRIASEFMVFNRAFNYLNQVDPLDKTTISVLLEFNHKVLNKTLEHALLYFQDREEYEKCAHIFKFQNLLKINTK